MLATTGPPGPPNFEEASKTPKKRPVVESRKEADGNLEKRGAAKLDAPPRQYAAEIPTSDSPDDPTFSGKSQICRPTQNRPFGERFAPETPFPAGRPGPRMSHPILGLTPTNQPTASLENAAG